MSSYRGGGRVEYEERERSRAGVREYQDVDVRVRERERESDRVPAFLREEVRRTDAGPLVLRARDVETVERPRRRSPSVTRVRAETREIVRARSVTPPPRRREVVERDDVEIRTRTIERERVRSPSRVRTRIVERERSPSPERIRTTRYVERRRSPSPVVDRERIRIIEHERERARTPSPSPSPSPPPVIRGPRVEREVITHYVGVDHGLIQARPPTPPPPPRKRVTERETDIDIYTSRHETEVDVHRRVSHSRGRARSPSVERRRPSVPAHYHDDEVIVRSDRNHLEVDIDHHHHHAHRSKSPGGHRRAHSAAPPARVRYDDQADYITTRIEDRGRMGEALHGHTRDWEIVDVPPGTERVRMDGVGGGAAEVTWSKYSGVRRAKFLPDGDTTAVVRAPAPARPRERERERETDTRINVQIYDDKKEERPVKEKRSDMWTEITKDLVSRAAIDEMGYEYEETEYFYYILTYLRYEDVLELVKLSDRIRRARKDRVREIEWDRDYRDDNWETDYHRHKHRHYSGGGYEDERITEREVIYDSGRPVRGYLR
ncbi:hypothetical protein GE09DRAFT_1114870 [Coniochaeta sp. 2T2.1]|nr:hypothetical protein GE09DRAFT_1114870 [Coniochaeta sp. 2T2.1]